MTDKIVKIIIKILLISLIIQVLNVPVVKASISWSEIFSEGENFVKTGKDANDEDTTTSLEKLQELQELNSSVYNILLALGIVLSVIIGAILGIKIMWGTIEQQVKAKEMLMPYAIGCVVIFGAFGIWKICITIFSKL